MSAVEKAATDEVNAEVIKWMAQKTDKKDIVAFYDKFNKLDATKSDYNGPQQLAGFLDPHMKTLDPFTSLLDIGAGTGFLGQELKKRVPDTVRLDAMDPSIKLMDSAKERNIYTNFYYDFVEGYGSTSLPNDGYDVVCCVGTFAPSHLPLDAIREMIRLTRPGGLVGIGMRIRYIRQCPEYKDWYPFIEQLEKDGVWQCLENHDNIPGYIRMGEEYDNGAMFVFRRLK